MYRRRTDLPYWRSAKGTTIGQSGRVANAEEEAQVASDVLESLDDLYDQCISVAQLRRLLTACTIALRGSALEPVVAAAAEALAGIAASTLTDEEMNSAALIATDELRRYVG
jgi:hypothetical protein